MHVAALQFPQPSATIQTDWNTRLSAQQRQTNFADVAKNGYLLRLHTSHFRHRKTSRRRKRLYVGAHKLHLRQMSPSRAAK